MKLLFLTQVLDRNDAVLGFVTRWIEGLARNCESVRVVALEVGDITGLPNNVDVREIGRRGRVRRWFRYRGVLREALRKEGFDTVLAHMVPRYTLVSSGPARAAGARSFLWYTHKGVDSRLRRAERQVEKIFTASVESLRLETSKRVVTGHGIDLAHFEPPAGVECTPGRLVSVGRLTPAKDPLTVLAAMSILVARGFDLHLDWVGAGLTDADEGFLRTVREQIQVGDLEDRVELHGAVPYEQVPKLYHGANVLVNASLTGSVDKVVLEAMAARRLVLSCNDSFPPIFACLGDAAPNLQFEAGNAQDLASRLEFLLKMDAASRASLTNDLHDIVARDHEVDQLMARLVREMQGETRG